MMSQDRTQCIGIEPPDDTGELSYHIVDIDQHPPMQFCIFGESICCQLFVSARSLSKTIPTEKTTSDIETN